VLTTLILSYYIQHFNPPVRRVHRPDETPAYIQNVHPKGSLTVDEQAPIVSSVAPGSQRVEMLRLKLTSTCTADVPIHTIAVQRRGMGSNSDIKAIYALHRGRRISRSRTIARKDGSVDINLRRFRIAKCSSEDVLILADFSENASPAGEHRIELRAVEAPNTLVRVEHRAGDFLRRTTGGRGVGQISVVYPKISTRIRYGTRQRVSRFSLNADSQDNHLIRAITFTNKGSANDDDLKNLFVEFRNRAISEVIPEMYGDSVRIPFTPPFLLRKGHKLSFAVRADVRAGRSRTIRFVIEEPSDVEADVSLGRGG